MSPAKNYRAEVYALVAYILLAIVLTYPLILNFATHVPGDGSDDPALAWNLWWVPHAIINLGQSPIYTQHMFYPIGLNLAFYTLTYLNAFLAIPFQYAFNVIVATNVNVLLSFALSGFGAYLLSKFLIQNSEFKIHDRQIVTLAAFAAGAVYAFSSNKFLYASLGQFNIASSHWIPFYVLFLLKLTARKFSIFNFRFSIYYGGLLGLFLLFQALSEFIFASFLIIFTLLYLIYWFAKNHFHPSSLILHPLIVATLVFIIPMSPILAAMLQDMLTEGDFIQSGLGFADVFSSDVFGFFVPSHLHPIFGYLEAQFHFTYINFAYLGFIALALAIVALIAAPRARIWGVFGLVFVAISLGPNVIVNGTRVDLPMPFDLLLEIPFVKGNRYPSRWSVMATLALSILVGYGIAYANQKLKAKSTKWHSLLPFAFLLLNCFEHFSAPLPLSNLTIPSVYQTIARDPGDFTVLEIPLAWRNGFRMTGTLDQAMMFAQFYQTAHRRPILGGNTSRNPELKFQYFTESPILQSLIAVETGHKLDDAAIARDKQLAPEVLRFFGVRYVVWHSPRNPENRAKLDAARAYVQFVLPVTQIAEVSDDTGETVVFRVNDLPPQNPTIIRPNDFLARLNFGEGWSALGGDKVWATRREAKLFVRLDSPRDAALSVRVFAPVPDQRVTLSCNGIEIGTLKLRLGWNDYTMNLKRESFNSGMNEIVLRFDLLASVASVREGNFAISRTGATSPVSLVAYSAGSEVGDFARIFVNGIDESQNKRGYNIVVVNEKTGVIESSVAFDTFASVEESARLAQFIDKIPTGRIVVIAVRDEASRNLTQEAIDVLRSIGAQVDLRNKWRWSHAIIGVKGAPPGSAQESANEIAPVQLVVGVGAMEPNVAAAFEWIEIK